MKNGIFLSKEIFFFDKARINKNFPNKLFKMLVNKLWFF
jgi:hypothetical protein